VQRRWGAPTDWDTVCRMASGRRRWNALRRLLADLRRIEVLRFMVELGPDYSPLQRGLKARISRALGVSPATISRDVRAIWAVRNDRRCPTCGGLLLTERDWERLDAVIGNAEAAGGPDAVLGGVRTATAGHTFSYGPSGKPNER